MNLVSLYTSILGIIMMLCSFVFELLSSFKYIIITIKNIELFIYFHTEG